MSNAELKKLCIDLVKCEDEDSVIELLKINNFWDDATVWKDLGNEENNWSVAGNQQGLPEKALVEKLINSVDSVLTAECIKSNIDPKGKNAPENINQAVDSFFNVPDGKLTNITATERTKLSKHIGLVSTGETGKDSKVCYSIFDLGEGQTPKEFPDTFLSIGKTNKIKIPFVQGKFNMGGTGVLRFCGKKHLQLILSKKNPILAGNLTSDDTKDMWGFTIIKRVPPTGNFRSSKYVYLAPGNNILSFNAASLPILPGKYPLPYEEELYFGTYIKLYDYRMNGLKDNINLSLYNRLSLLMPSLALPIRLYERREGYRAHSFETTLNGLSVRLEEDKRNNLESDEWPSTHDITIMGEQLKVSIYAFKRDIDEKKAPTAKYVKNEGIIFTVNGQTHGDIHKRFFSKKVVGLGNLKDSLIVIVNCSQVSGETREDLFMNSRDRLIESGDLRDQIEQQLITILKEHKGLSALKSKRLKEDIENRLDDSKPLYNVIEKLIKKSPTLAKLFIAGAKLSNPVDIENKKEIEVFNGKKFPSYFKLIKDYPISSPKLVAINNKTIRIQFKTDASNDYFERESDCGEHKLQINGSQFMLNKSMNLWNGYATLNIEIDKNFNEGDIVKFSSVVNDITMIEPIIEEFYIKIDKSRKKGKGKKGNRKNPSDKKTGDKSQDKGGLTLPKIIKVKQDDWNRHGFTKYSALKVEYLGEELGWTFYINIHNIHLLAEIKASKNDLKLIEAQYSYAMVLLGLSIINNYDDYKNDKIELDVSEVIGIFSSSISPVILPMISSLGDLDNIEIEMTQDEE